MIKTFESFKNSIISYHGGESFDKIRPGLFTTTDKEAVMWYVNRAMGAAGFGSGGDYRKREAVLVTLRINSDNSLKLDNAKDFEDKWVPILKDADIDYEYENDKYGWRFKSNDINKYGGSSTENPFDLIYVPGFIESAIEKGYDCVEGWDEFFQGSIYIYIPLDPKKVEIIDTKIFKPTDLDSE